MQVDREIVCQKTCSGKVNIVIGKHNILGYILEDLNDRWKIHLANDEIIWLNKLHYDEETNKYEYVPVEDTKKKYITMYWPIRLLINQNGNCKMTLNKVAFDSSSNNIVPQHTT